MREPCKGNLFCNLPVDCWNPDLFSDPNDPRVPFDDGSTTLFTVPQTKTPDQEGRPEEEASETSAPLTDNNSAAPTGLRATAGRQVDDSPKAQIVGTPASSTSSSRTESKVNATCLEDPELSSLKREIKLLLNSKTKMELMNGLRGVLRKEGQSLMDTARDINWQMRELLQRQEEWSNEMNIFLGGETGSDVLLPSLSPDTKSADNTNQNPSKRKRWLESKQEDLLEQMGRKNRFAGQRNPADASNSSRLLDAASKQGLISTKKHQSTAITRNASGQRETTGVSYHHSVWNDFTSNNAPLSALLSQPTSSTDGPNTYIHNAADKTETHDKGSSKQSLLTCSQRVPPFVEDLSESPSPGKTRYDPDSDVDESALPIQQHTSWATDFFQSQRMSPPRSPTLDFSPVQQTRDLNFRKRGAGPQLKENNPTQSNLPTLHDHQVTHTAATDNLKPLMISVIVKLSKAAKDLKIPYKEPSVRQNAEALISHMHTVFSEKQLRSELRTILLDMQQNKTLLQRFLAGNLTPIALLSMSAEDRACDEVKKRRKTASVASLAETPKTNVYTKLYQGDLRVVDLEMPFSQEIVHFTQQHA